MELIRTAADLTTAVHARRSAAADVGLVPTMGALHDGHASLIRRARNERETVVVSIFVNPKQFGPGEDLTRYPRDETRDLALCDRLGVDLVWAPSTVEFYPPGVEIRFAGARPDRRRSGRRGPARSFRGCAQRRRSAVRRGGPVGRVLRRQGRAAALPRPADGRTARAARHAGRVPHGARTRRPCPVVPQRLPHSPRNANKRGVSSWHSRRRRSSRAPGNATPPCWSRRWLARSVPRRSPRSTTPQSWTRTRSNRRPRWAVPPVP